MIVMINYYMKLMINDYNFYILGVPESNVFGYFLCGYLTQLKDVQMNCVLFFQFGKYLFLSGKQIEENDIEHFMLYVFWVTMQQ